MTPASKRRLIIVLVILLLLLLVLLGIFKRGPLRFLGGPSVTVVPVPPPSVTTPTPATPTTPTPVSPTTLPKHVPAKPTSPTSSPAKPPAAVPVTSSTATLVLPPTPVAPPPAVTPVPPGQEGMRRDLIPKNITIVRCYYDEEVVAPGETFGFDINGSGFTETFQQMIEVTLDGLDLSVKNLTLATANQIHGQIEVGPEATTQYNNPIILIHNLPVFRAPDPFGVVRHGEVLDVLLTEIDDSGQYGKFKVITNLDDGLFKRIKITPTTTKLDVSNVKSELPFYVKGDISIAPGLSSGSYGLVVDMAGHELFRKDPLVDVVRPNVGKTGSVESLKATDLAHRPYDDVELTMKGSGFLPSEVSRLTAKVSPFDMGDGSFTWVTGGRVDLHLTVPPAAPVGVYGVTILDRGKDVFDKQSVFAIVPANWLAGVTLPQALAPGSAGVLNVKGRDLSPSMVQSIQIQTDEPKLQISNLRWQDPSTLVADVKTDPNIAPGDYLLDIQVDGKHKNLPQGSIIRITH